MTAVRAFKSERSKRSQALLPERYERALGVLFRSIMNREAACLPWEGDD